MITWWESRWISIIFGNRRHCSLFIIFSRQFDKFPYLCTSTKRTLREILAHPKWWKRQSWSQPIRYRSCWIWWARCFSCTAQTLSVHWSWSVSSRQGLLSNLRSARTNYVLNIYIIINQLFSSSTILLLSVRSFHEISSL